VTVHGGGDITGARAVLRAATAGEPGGSPAGRPGAIPFHFEPGGLLLVLSGPSGAGKGTLVERLVASRPGCVFSISATTRPRRANEVDGVQYEFVSRSEFERRRSAGLFLEWAEVHDHLYATPVRFVDEQVHAGRIVVLDVDVQGGASVRRARPDAVSVFIYPPSIDALRQRLLKRGTDAPAVVEVRLRNAPGELAEWREYDYLVMNDDLEQAVARLIAIVDAERARVRRLHPGS
jgi:guanylate kinase